LTETEPANDAPRGANARDFIFFLHAWCPRGARAWVLTGSDHDQTLPVVLLGGIIENQNSDFVM
jgi:hypothetical protein